MLNIIHSRSLIGFFCSSSLSGLPGAGAVIFQPCCSTMVPLNVSEPAVVISIGFMIANQSYTKNLKRSYVRRLVRVRLKYIYILTFVGREKKYYLF